MMHPETEAIQLLEELGITSLPINPVKIIEALGISNFEHSFKSIEGISFSDPSGNRLIVGVNSRIKELGRKNFTYAHELGHLCLDAFPFNKNIKGCQKKDITYKSKGLNQMEINANIFASHLLLPDFLIKDKIQSIEPDWKKISRLARMTETSLITMARRFIEITDHICLLAVASQDRIIKYFEKSPNWSLYFDMNSRALSPASYAHKSCNQENIPDDFGIVPANIWLDDRRIPSDSKLLEWTLPLNSYGKALILLWDEEDLLSNSADEGAAVFDNGNKIGGVWDPPTFHK